MKNKYFQLIWLIVPVVVVIGYPFSVTSPNLLKILASVLSLYTLFFSIVVHEVSHGLAAKLSGDTTADGQGRLTLNPIVHVSPVGSIIVPLALYLLHSPAILGWAKPVPFNPLNFKENPRDQVVVSLAGPLSNFTLSYLCLNLYILFGYLHNLLNPDTPLLYSLSIFEPLAIKATILPGFWFMIFTLLSAGIIINIALGVFNLIPFPPLDGSWILKATLSPKLNVLFGKIQPYGFILLLAAVHLNLLETLFYPIITLVSLASMIMEFCL